MFYPPFDTKQVKFFLFIKLKSAILIFKIGIALFIFPKSIDKEVFSTMPMYFCCFLSINQPHDP